MRISIRLNLIFATLSLATAGAFAASQEATPKYGPDTIRLQDAREHVRKREAPDFWALMPYYLPQKTGSACSIGSVAMLMNAVRADRKLPSDEKLVTQDGLLDRVKDSRWKRAVGKGGQGVTLSELGGLIEKSLKAYSIPVEEVRVVHVEKSNEATRKELRKLLERNEKSTGDFLVVNFLQSVYTGDPEGDVGHIAPVGAYDSKSDRVLILDPDREWYEPYWVSLEAFARGMATRDGTAGKNRGYVYVRLKSGS